MTSLCFPGEQNPSKHGSTLKEKNLLLEEQILFFKSSPLLEREARLKLGELLPLKVFLLT